MAKRKNSAAKIANGRRKTKSKRKPIKKKKAKSTSWELPSRKLVMMALGLFFLGYGGTWVAGLIQSTPQEGKEVSKSVLTTLSEPSLFDKVADRLLDRDLPHLKKESRAQIEKPKEAQKVERQAKAEPTPLRAPLRELKISEERKMKPANLSKSDKAELDKILSKYGF
tara:strand:- start:86 stop:589 length:504 start_codon:yes stop_codon:yes gene_type:complete